jgi:hypothetical protein
VGCSGMGINVLEGRKRTQCGCQGKHDAMWLLGNKAAAGSLVDCFAATP